MIGFIGEYEATLDAKGAFCSRRALKNNCRKVERTFCIEQGI